jgi:hypothetical protein
MTITTVDSPQCQCGHRQLVHTIRKISGTRGHCQHADPAGTCPCRSYTPQPPCCVDAGGLCPQHAEAHRQAQRAAQRARVHPETRHGFRP